MNSRIGFTGWDPLRDKPRPAPHQRADRNHESNRSWLQYIHSFQQLWLELTPWRRLGGEPTPNCCGGSLATGSSKKAWNLPKGGNPQFQQPKPWGGRAKRCAPRAGPCGWGNCWRAPSF
eukprot:2610069-Alexandrium_andersonii.AAC.1